MIRALCVLLSLSGCASKPLLTVPASLTSCADPVAVPAPLPRIRTMSQVSHFAIALELAREAERRRGDDCAKKLADLNRLIERVIDGH